MANQATRVRIRVLLIFAAGVGVVALLVWSQARRSSDRLTPADHTQRETQPHSASPSPSAEPSVPSSLGSTPSPADMKADPGTLADNNQVSPDLNLANNFVGTLKLIIPVAGIKPGQLLDTFTDSRSEGRVHDAIDIPAPAGTPVLAVTDGEIIKLFQSERGGTTIYQLSADKKLVFYYAHLQRYADGLAVGQFSRQGEVIAFVGDTGNAVAGNYHLHFSVSIVADPKRYWEGKNINPYPLLRGK